MKTKGVRILDKTGVDIKIVDVELPDILEEIRDGDSFHWAILYLEAMGNLGKGKSITIFEQQIMESENGFYISWYDLKLLSKKFHQIIDIVLIGCKEKKLLHRYENDQDMYETCDIVVQMIDSSYWEVFSKDEALVNRLATKFKDIKFLESDFEK